jgi:putative tricarboxylic transport membrane protein
VAARDGRGGPAIGDLVFAAAIIAVAAVVWIGTADLPPPRWEPVGSAAIPRGVALIMAVLATVVAVRALRVPPAGNTDAPMTPRALARVVALSGVLVLTVALMDARIVGFRAGAIGFLFLAGLILGGLNVRNAAISAAFAVVLALSLHAVFTRLFYIDLP